MENAGMTTASPEAKWPRLLALSVHEFRTPVTVVAGYIRMLLKDRAGPLNEQQRHMLEEAEKSCGRLSALIAEMSVLSNLEAGTAPMNRSSTDLRAVLANAVASLPAVPDRNIDVELSTGEGAALMDADPSQLQTALTSVVIALRRELVTTTTLFVKERRTEFRGKPASWIALGDIEHIAELEASTPETLTTFNEWRGGSGLSLAVARRIIEAHGGAAWSPGQGTKAGAVVVLPTGS
jgi:signal transduction histidine kinase